MWSRETGADRCDSDGFRRHPSGWLRVHLGGSESLSRIWFELEKFRFCFKEAGGSGVRTHAVALLRLAKLRGFWITEAFVQLLRVVGSMRFSVGSREFARLTQIVCPCNKDSHPKSVMVRPVEKTLVRNGGGESTDVQDRLQLGRREGLSLGLLGGLV